MALRDPVDVLRTKFWYEGLCARLRVTTAYALEKRIEPDAFKKNDDNVSIHRNKWWRYRSGLHTPNTATCSLTDRIVVGSSAELNHPLWNLLRADSRVTNGGSLLRALSPDLQLILFEPHEHFHIYGGNRLFGKIEHRASLDALACLTLLLRINYQAGHHDRVWEYAHYILRMLLILGKLFDDRGLAEELFEIYSRRIFNLAKFDGRKICLNEYDYATNIAILHQCARSTNQVNGVRNDWREQIRVMRKILDGMKGFDIKFVLDAQVEPDLDLGPPAYEDITKSSRNRRLREWSLNNILCGGKKYFPPSDVWKD